MKKIIVISLLISFLIGFSLTKGIASDWTSVVDLEGFWNFSIGDDPKWADPKYNTDDWDRIFVPLRWEDAYPDYNGYAWYRKAFDIRWGPNDTKLTLMLGRIDDVDEVFLNGVKIGQTGSFFPHYATAYNIERKYTIPAGLLKQQNNVLAIRVFDEGGEGGVVAGNDIGLFYDNDIALLSLNLEGEWKFSTYRQQGMNDLSFDDDKWSKIQVPGNWENQGFENYDGYAWYRKIFTLPPELKNEELYLILGKIDDYDKVYLNGEMIGRTEYLDRYSRYNKSNAWRLYRVYKVPPHLLQQKNVIVVEVRDIELGGGIYEGPVGLANYRNAKIVEERQDENYWENTIDGILRLFNLY